MRYREEHNEYASLLFNAFPTFRPTRSLYLDFEGSLGAERILGLYWPQLAGDSRFRMLWRGFDGHLDGPGLQATLAELDCDPENLRWVVVFSGGDPVPDEHTRFEHVFGPNFFPVAEWVNLHYWLRRARKMRRAIKTHRHVWFTKDEKQTRLSLEALEFQFGLRRPRPLRSASNSYADGSVGEIGILELEARLLGGNANDAEIDQVVDYCTWDVQSMFKIARACEKLVAR